MHPDEKMTETPRLWAMLTAEEHEFQYNPQKAFPNFAEFRKPREPANAAALETLNSDLDVPYGGNALHRLDVFPANSENGRQSPVHVFFHGGYWRAQDKANFTFVAGMLVPGGITTVVANYELCPNSTPDGVV